MGFQYKFDIEGKVYDLIPNYPQENTIDLNVLNQLCYLFRYEQETYKKPKQREEDTFQNYQGYIEHLLKTRQDEIIQEIHCGCYEKEVLQQMKGREDILFQYLFQKEKLSLSAMNAQKIFDFYACTESDCSKSLLSLEGAMLLGETWMPKNLAITLLKKQMTKEKELKTRFLNGRMLLLLRGEYKSKIKQEVLRTYSNAEFMEEKKNFERFYRGLSLAVAILQETKVNTETAFSCPKEEPFCEEYVEASKILPLNTGNQLLLKMTRTLSLLEEEEKKRKRPLVVPVHKRHYSPSFQGKM